MVRAIPHNSKCRYGERGAADAKPKAQIILDAAKVSAASGGNSEPKQGQRSQSARGFCPRSTMRVPQPDIIEHFGNADAVPQPPERCLSRKAGIMRCCLSFLRIWGILFGGFGAACASYSRGLSVSLGSAGSFYFASGGRTGKHSGFLVGWNDGLGWIFVQGGRTEFSPADYDIPHIHPINNLWGGISPSRRGEPCWFVLCPLKYLQETMLLLRAVPRGVERCRGAAERTGRCLHLSPQMLEG